MRSGLAGALLRSHCYWGRGESERAHLQPRMSLNPIGGGRLSPVLRALSELRLSPCDGYSADREILCGPARVTRTVPVGL